MLTAALDGLVARFGLEGERVGEVVAGAVLKHSRDFNLTRESVLGSRLAPETPAYDLQQACGTGLQAAVHGRQQDRARPDRGRHRGRRRHHLRRPDRGRREAPQDPARGQPGQVHAGSAGGAREDPPAAPRSRRSRRTASRARGCRWASHAALTALEWQITREAQDELAVASHHHLAAAYDRGFQDDLITPFHGVERDQNLRADSSLEKLATLKPVFGKGEAATMTAGNSTPLTDGASTVLLASEDWATEHGRRCWPTSTDAETAAVDFVHGGEGLLMAPAYAVPRMLERDGLTLQDFDFYEIHEAFASQVLATLKAWEDPVFCKERLGLDAPLGSIDREQAQRQRLLAGRGPPLRRHRRPDRRQPGQAPRRAGRAAA